MTNDGLLTYARNSYPGDAALVPDLATALPHVRDGGRTFIFRLRGGVHYSNGIVVRPEDFRRALEREYQAGSGLAAMGVPIAGSEHCGCTTPPAGSTAASPSTMLPRRSPTTSPRPTRLSFTSSRCRSGRPYPAAPLASATVTLRCPRPGRTSSRA